MSNSTTDRSLLFGLIAMQNGLITRENLMTATGLWLQDKSQSMDKLLLSQKFITKQQHSLLSELVNMHLEKHDGDAERSLAAVDAITSVRDELCKIGDEDVEQTLGHINQARNRTSSDETIIWTPPETGQRFRILRPHAKGGLGIVNIAHDAELNREVALKEIQEKHADDPNSRSRFIQEAEITGGLEHPGIVPVYGLGTHDDNRPFYAMRLIRGDTLEDAIKLFHQKEKDSINVGTRRLEMRRLLAHFINLCNAIEYAHSRGILHRDIKPANVMLGKYGETLVVDWGLAKAIDRKEEYRRQEEQTLHPVSGESSSATQMGSAVGTPSYMSPEQAAGRMNQLDTTTDVYSLGATLYCLLTGRAPLADLDSRSAVRKAQTGDFPTPRSIKSDVPPMLESACLKAMSLKPEDRYASAEALSEDVERFLADEPIEAHIESFSERFTRLTRRHRAWFRAGAAALLLITIGSLVAALIVNAAREDQARQRIEAQRLAGENAELAQKETAAREKVESQLRRSDQIRLASQAAILQEKMPQRALLLAAESIDSARVYGDEPYKLAYEVLQSTLADTGGEVIFHSDATLGLTFDGRWLAESERSGKSMQYWKLKPHETVPTQKISFGDLPDRSARARSSNGRWWAAGDAEGTIYLYDFTAPDPEASMRKWKAHNGAVTQSNFISDSGQLLSASTEDVDFKIWNFQQKNPHSNVTRFPKPFNNPLLYVSPDGKNLAISDRGDDDDLFIWDISSGKPPRKKLTLKRRTSAGNLNEKYLNFIFSPNGRYLAVAVNNSTIRVFSIRLWDLESDSPLDSVNQIGSHEQEILGLLFTPDGKNLISYSFDGTARLLPIGGGGRRVTLRGHEGFMTVATLSPSGQFLATGGTDNTVRLWNLDRSNPNENVRVLRGHEGVIYKLAFSPSSKILYSLCNDGTARKWTIGGEQIFSTQRMLHSNSTYSFGRSDHTALNSDFYLLAKIPGDDWRRWNFGSNNLTGELLNIPKELNALTLLASSDGRWLISWRFHPALSNST